MSKDNYIEYKKELLNRLRAGVEANSTFTEDNFFEEVSQLLIYYIFR